VIRLGSNSAVGAWSQSTSENQDDQEEGSSALMRDFLVTFVLVFGYCLSVAVPALLAQQSPSKVNLQQLGPQIGEKAPDFELQDQSGKKWSRDSVMGPNGAMLVFFRSADW
jgi:cytochrome oxidase Cu insertion factor (SCO1/SenC/PrrC family)